MTLCDDGSAAFSPAPHMRPGSLAQETQPCRPAGKGGRAICKSAGFAFMVSSTGRNEVQRERLILKRSKGIERNELTGTLFERNHSPDISRDG